MIKVLDACEEKISSACNYNLSAEIKDKFNRCDESWKDLKTESEKCEKESVDDCNCWANVSRLKDEFHKRCISEKENGNVTGEKMLGILEKSIKDFGPIFICVHVGHIELLLDH